MAKKSIKHVFKGKSGKKKLVVGGLLGAAALFLFSGKAKAATNPSAPSPGPSPVPIPQAPSAPVPQGPPVPHFSGNPGPGEAIVNTHDSGPSGDLRIRDQPSLSGNIEGTAAHGATVTITGDPVSGDGSQDPQGWYPIAADVTGWASGVYLAIGS